MVNQFQHTSLRWQDGDMLLNPFLPNDCIWCPET